MLWPLSPSVMSRCGAESVASPSLARLCCLASHDPLLPLSISLPLFATSSRCGGCWRFSRYSHTLQPRSLPFAGVLAPPCHSPCLTLSLYMPLPSLCCSERHRHRRAMTSSASSTPRRLARSCCREQVTRTALASVSSVPKHSQRASRHSLVQRHRVLRPLQRPFPRHLGLSLLSLRRALRHVRLHHPPLL